jgi:hypothetical protein
MAQSQFWQWVDDQAATDQDWMEWAVTEDELWQQARDRLLLELPDAAQWRRWADELDTNNRHLMPELLFSLAWGAHDGHSPMPQRFQPENILLHFSEDEFENILHQKVQRGAIVFLWDIYYNEDGFKLPDANETLNVFVSRKMRNDEDTTGYERPSGVVLGFIRKNKLEVFVFPRNWYLIVDRVRATMKQMTAVQKGRKQLSHDLLSLVELLGWDTVNDELARLRR